MASEGFHELPQDLTPQTRDMHRAIRSASKVPTKRCSQQNTTILTFAGPAREAFTRLRKQLGIVIEKVHHSPVIDGAALFSTRGGVSDDSRRRLHRWLPLARRDRRSSLLRRNPRGAIADA